MPMFEKPISLEPYWDRGIASLRASPLGQRMHLNSEEVIDICSRPSLIWGLVDLATKGAPRPHVRIIDPPLHWLLDLGHWLDPKSVGLPAFGSLEIINTRGFEKASLFGDSPFADWLKSYTPPRVRAATREQAIDQIQRATVSIIFDSLILADGDLSWIGNLKPGQLVVSDLIPPTRILSCIHMVNCGVTLDERIISVPSGEAQTAVNVFIPTGLGEPLPSPIDPADLAPEFTAAPALQFYAPDDHSGDLRVCLSASQSVDLEGIVRLHADDHPIVSSYNLGPLHPELPPALRFMYAVAVGSPSNEIEVAGKKVPVPPLYVGEASASVREQLSKLIRRGALPAAHEIPRDDLGRSLISMAILFRDDPIRVLQLVGHGFDPDAQDDFGWTPVCYAAALGLTDHVDAFLDIADLSIEVIEDVTVRDLLVHYGFDIDVDSEDVVQEFSNTPLLAPSLPVIGVEPSPLGVVISPEGDLQLPDKITRKPLADSLASLVRRPITTDEAPRSDATPRSVPAKALADDEFTALLPATGKEAQFRKVIQAIEPEAPKTVPKLSEVEPIYAGVVDIPTAVEPGAIRATILAWLKQVSESLADLDPLLPRFDSERFSVLSDEDPETGLFALRFDNITPTFTYRTEFVVFPHTDTTIVSTRLQAIRAPECEDDVEPSVPRIVSSFAELGARHRNLPLGRTISVTNEAEAQVLSDIIFDADRVLPILAVFGDTDLLLGGLPPPVRSSFLIVQVSPKAGHALQRHIGKDFIAYRGAWRIYPAGLKPDSSRYDAPLILDPGALPPGRLSSQIRHTLWRLSRSITEEDAPTYLTVRRLILDRQKATQARLDALKVPEPSVAKAPPPQKKKPAPLASLAPEPSAVEELKPPAYAHPAPASPLLDLQRQVESLNAAVADLTSRIDRMTREHRSELQSAMEEVALWKDRAEINQLKVTGLTEERDAAKSESFTLRQKLKAITSGVTEEPASFAEISYPDSLDALEDWVERYEGRIVITKKALKAARSVRSEPHIVAKCYDAIDILANEFLDAVTGDQAARERLLQRERETQLEITAKVGEAVNNHRYASEYSATVGTKKFVLDKHVREFGGTDRNPERQLRIYYAFDDDQVRVVVGHLPTHLTSSHT